MISLSDKSLFIEEPQHMFTYGQIVHITARSIQIVACMFEYEKKGNT